MADLFGLSSEESVAVERCVSQFEEAWQKGEQPRISHYLPAQSPLRQAVLLELVLVEMELRHSLHESVSPHEYLARYPEFECSPDLKARLLAASEGHEWGGPAASSLAPENAQPTLSMASVPRFQPLRPHARGGLGQVFVAMDKELSREVALKEILPEFADLPPARDRFVQEASITGNLEHPNIVPVYGLGAYADGRPYYAMRFIRGESLWQAIERFHAADAPADRPRNVQLRELLSRFVAVCHAIEYAHSRGVLHRDLKPGNIVLGKYGETLVVDWGLAKQLQPGAAAAAAPAGSQPNVTGSQPDSTAGMDSALQADHADTAPQAVSGETADATETGTLLGTPAYSSPEQLAGRLRAMGPASDIYSLGATLFAILTGRPPYPKTAGQEPPSAERRPVTLPRTLQPWIPRPLEAICLKAMAAAPGDRYATSRALSEDIERFLADEPVAAHAESWLERGSRFARKHRRGVQAAALALAAISFVSVAALVVVNFALERERAANFAMTRALDSERVARQQADGVSEFLVSAFRRADPERDGRSITIAETLDQALSELAAREVEPSLRARLLETIGTTYLGLGIPERAEETLQKARELHRQTRGPTNPLTLDVASNLAVAMQRSGKVAAAQALLEETLAASQRTLGPTHPDTLTTRNNLAQALLEARQYKAAISEFEQTLAARTQTLGPTHMDTLSSQANLAAAFLVAGQPERGLPMLEETLATARKSLGNEHLATLTWMHNLASAYQDAGQRDQALPLFEEALAYRRKRLGPEHPETTSTQGNLARLYQDLGQVDKALPLLEQALQARKKNLGDTHPLVLRAMNNLAFAYQRAGKGQQALTLFQEVLAVMQEQLPEEDPDLLTLKNNVAQMLQQQGQGGLSLPLLEQVYQARLKAHGFTHPQTLIALNNLADAYRESGRYMDALPLLEEVHAQFKQQHGPDHELTLAAENNLARTLRAAGKVDRATLLFEHIWQVKQHERGPNHIETMLAANNLASALRESGQAERAASLFKQAYQQLRQSLGPDHQQTLVAMNNYATVLREAGQLALAKRVFKEACLRMRNVLPKEHPHLFLAETNYARTLLAMGDAALAESILQRQLKTLLAIPAAETAPAGLPSGESASTGKSPDPREMQWVSLWLPLAEASLEQNSPAAALAWLDKALPRLRRQSPLHPAVVDAESLIGLTLAKLGRHQQAEVWLKDAVRISQTFPLHDRTANEQRAKAQQRLQAFERQWKLRLR